MSEPQIFFIPVLSYEDGTLAVVDSDIKGLIIEVSSYDELIIELPRVAYRLLKSNHQLTDEQMAQAILVSEISPFQVQDTVHNKETSSLPSLPRMLWGDKKHSQYLEYA
ncbi:MAG: hypothetical protein OXI44_01400 [Bacteroidota bacterium]|nr:hypothetical protein [Bacteroidota bacterium]